MAADSRRKTIRRSSSTARASARWDAQPSVQVPAGAQVIDLTGHTIMPGIIGLHDHMYYSSPVGGSMRPMLFSYPRLFLATGVTTIRTTGSVDSYQELNLKAAIGKGEIPGPEIHVTGPYLQGQPGQYLRRRCIR